MKIKIEAVLTIDSESDLNRILNAIEDGDTQNIFSNEIYCAAAERYVDSIFITKSII